MKTLHIDSYKVPAVARPCPRGLGALIHVLEATCLKCSADPYLTVDFTGRDYRFAIGRLHKISLLGNVAQCHLTYIIGHFKRRGDTP